MKTRQLTLLTAAILKQKWPPSCMYYWQYAWSTYMNIWVVFVTFWLDSVYYIWLCSIKTAILKNKMAAIQISLLAIFRVNMRICVVIVIFWLWVVCADSYIPLTLQSIYEEAHFEIQNGCHIKFLIGNILGVHVKSCSFRDILTSS
jgi:hypothetical protein